MNFIPPKGPLQSLKSLGSYVSGAVSGVASHAKTALAPVQEQASSAYAWAKSSVLGRFVRTHSGNVQFAGYEIGNGIATVAGAGGFGRFAEQVGGVAGDTSLGVLDKVSTLAATYPDAAVTVGLGATVLGAPLAKQVLSKAGISADSPVDFATAVLGAGLLTYAMVQDTSWITASASSFVIGSAFLRQSQANPLWLKMGGLFLAIGGMALAGFGVENFDLSLSSTFDALLAAMNGMSVATGLAVTGASLLTYGGGMFFTSQYRDRDDREKLTTVSDKLFHPTRGHVARLATEYLDDPIDWINHNVVDRVASLWIPEGTRSRPLETSMWLRLPFRVGFGGAALAAAGVSMATTGTDGGLLALVAANALWSLGDVSVGAMDWEVQAEEQAA